MSGFSILSNIVMGGSCESRQEKLVRNMRLRKAEVKLSLWKWWNAIINNNRNQGGPRIQYKCIIIWTCIS